MGRLWKRNWRVTVHDVQSTEIDFRFSVKRGLAGVGTADVAVYNLTQDHQTRLTSQRRPLVRVEVGYGRDLFVLFQGSGRRPSIAREGPDWIVKVPAGDGIYAVRTARVSRAFGPQTSLADVVRACADALGLDAGNVNDVVASASLDQVGNVFPRGTVVHGNAARHLTRMLRSAGLEWSVQNGVLQVLRRGGALQRQAVRLSKDTGLLGAPTVAQNRVVSCEALLIPDLVPGALVSLDSSVINGTYRIEAATYSGDTRADDWKVQLTLRAPRQEV